MTVHWRCAIAGTAIAAAAMFAASGPALGKELRYGTFVPSVTNFVKETVKTFDGIEKATNGALTFKTFPNGEVIKFRTALKGIASGIVDIGHVVWVIHPTEMPRASLAAQALAFSDSVMSAAGAVAEFHMVTCKDCRKEYEKANVMPLGGEAGSRYVLMCTREFKSVDDLKGVRVRAVGAMARWAKELGMIPTRIASTEVLQSMQRGVIQCALGLLPWLRAYSLKDATKFIIDTRVGAALGGGSWWMNMQSWAKLSTAHKKAMIDALPGHIYRLMEVGMVSEAEDARKKAIAAGIKVTDGGPAYYTKWKAFSAKERNTLVALAGKRKVANPEKFVDSMLGVFDTWNKLMAGKENDRAHFENLIRTRVIAKSPLLK